MREHSFRGVTFRTGCVHADNDSFCDEQDVRDRWWHPKAGELVIDVGAGVGSYTLPSLALGAKVIALAPDPAHRKELIGNLMLNDGFRERCAVLWFGAHRERGWLSLIEGRRYDFSEDKPDQEVTGFPVDLLDDHVGAMSSVDWIKIDVEGHEVAVLEGAEVTIRRYRPRILVENHLFMDLTLQEQVVRFIDGLELGYKHESVNHHGVSHSFFEVAS